MRVVVASGELGRVRAALEPPVHARQLDAKLACRFKFVNHVSADGLTRGLEAARPPGAVEDVARAREHALRVLRQQARIPRQEKVAIGRRPAAAVRHKEARLPRRAVVMTGVMRARQAPLRVANRVCRALQVREHVLIVALELAHAGKPPAAVALRVGRVAQLARWAQADRDLRQHGSCGAPRWVQASVCGAVPCMALLSQILALRQHMEAHHHLHGKRSRELRLATADCPLSTKATVLRTAHDQYRPDKAGRWMG
eukprot:355368-Chlamydomonas_euryale.AAC.10